MRPHIRSISGNLLPLNDDLDPEVKVGPVSSG